MSGELPCPAGQSAKVSILNSAFLLDFPTRPYFQPEIDGFTKIDLPCYVFLIENQEGRKVLFDLGLRKDWEKLAPGPLAEIKHDNMNIEVKTDVIDVLRQHNISGQDIEAVVFSHHHWDHVGDMSRLPKETKLVVGPGFMGAFTPGFPVDEHSEILVGDYEGRTIHELEFSDSNTTVNIGQLRGYDYFGDGSFYLVNAPGHSIGHVCGLARTSTKPDTFVFMGADTCHHSAELRPSDSRPLPENISIQKPPPRHGIFSCAGAAFERHLQKHSRLPTSTFFDLPDYETFTKDMPNAIETLTKVQHLDGFDNVFVILAHDGTINSIVDFFPKTLNGWKKSGWGDAARWAFLYDIRGCVTDTVE